MRGLPDFDARRFWREVGDGSPIRSIIMSCECHPIRSFTSCWYPITDTDIALFGLRGVWKGWSIGIPVAHCHRIPVSGRPNQFRSVAEALEALGYIVLFDMDDYTEAMGIEQKINPWVEKSHPVVARAWAERLRATFPGPVFWSGADRYVYVLTETDFDMLARACRCSCGRHFCSDLCFVTAPIKRARMLKKRLLEVEALVKATDRGSATRKAKRTLAQWRKEDGREGNQTDLTL